MFPTTQYDRKIHALAAGNKLFVPAHVGGEQGRHDDNFCMAGSSEKARER